MVDISMTVNPSFFDEECAIVFSFYFKHASKKVGEAIIYTCAEDGSILEGFKNTCQNYEKVAYFREFSIIEEYEEQSLHKIEQFLKVLGIKKYFWQNHFLCL
ncbi:hypothetical protein [Peribacillus tepidiphilus]|uniref:hypothetical protein n=1 Tax=Peribacillus tepidiphilus TaxID=2652445 RepID=UPI00129299CC|nr:hypothetical protein [Peribacillus tepidiphilus]